MVVLGYDSTTPVGMDEMLTMAAAVRRGLKTPLLIGDLPFGSYEASNEQAIENAQRFVKEAGCDAVKLERGGASVDRARAIVRAGIPVMGHVGLTPQTATALGGFKAQGKTAEQAAKLAEEALALQAVGCFAIVFEAVPAAVTEALMPKLEMPGDRDRRRRRPPTARCSSSTTCSASTTATCRSSSSATPSVRDAMVAGVRAYAERCARGRFPERRAHLLDRARASWRQFRRYLDQESLAGASLGLVARFTHTPRRRVTRPFRRGI